MIWNARLLLRPKLHFKVNAPPDIERARAFAQDVAARVHGTPPGASVLVWPDFDHANVRNAGDGHAMPDPFHTDQDTGELPEGCVRAYDVEHGAQVKDRAGQRFRVMGYGAVQGTVTMRDHRRRLFYAEGDMIVRPA